MAHISRRELKTDEFISGLDAAWEYFLAHRRGLLSAGAVIVGAALLTWGWMSWRSHRLARAQSYLAQGIELFHAPISAQSLPGGQPSFPDAQARARAALADFQRAAAYSHTPPARLARYYAALAEIAAGQPQRGVAALRQLSRDSDPNLAAFARSARANYELSQGHDAAAAAQLQKLLQHPAPALPRAAVLWQLATIESRTNPPAAARLYRELVEQYPNTQTAQDAAQHLGQEP